MQNDLFRFDDKVILITGAATGIGRATALAFAERGASLVIGDMNEEGAQETVSLAKEKGAKATFLKTDVSKFDDVGRLVETAVSTYGRLDYAFNNAGIAAPAALLHEMDEAAFDRVIAVDLKGVYNCLHHELKHMVKAGKGSIVNTASVAGLIPEPGLANYVAAKHGVVGLTKTAGLDYASRGIRINAIAPGWIETPMTRAMEDIPGFWKFLEDGHPMHRAGKPDEMAGVVLFLCSDAASYVTGQTYVADGGQTVRGLFPYM